MIVTTFIIMVTIALMGVAFAMGMAVSTRHITPLRNILDDYEATLEQIADGPVSEPQTLAFLALNRHQEIGK